MKIDISQIEDTNNIYISYQSIIRETFRRHIWNMLTNEQKVCIINSIILECEHNS
jgi:hypothetical protein